MPDATTVWRFRERPKELGLIEPLFNRFSGDLAAEGYQAKQGQIVGASFIALPIQRNSREENCRIKAGAVPEDWSPATRAHQDIEARWTKKRGASTFGDKNHLDVDAAHKLIRSFTVTPAPVHDSQVFDDLIDPDKEDPEGWADSAYRRAATEAVPADAGYASHICAKGQAGQPLSAEPQAHQCCRSQIRPRVEHGFGFQQNSMAGKLIRTIGLARTEVKIGLMNMTDHLMRYLQLTKHRGDAPGSRRNRSLLVQCISRY